jgi:chloramphenicol 3-O phosphotransferase
VGLDKFLNMLHENWFRQPQWNEVMGKSNASGPLGDQLISGMHHSIEAMLRQGNSVIADHVMIERSWILEAARLFAPHQAYFIGIRCPLHVVEERERERKNRTLGSARLQFEVVHRWARYDLEIDSSLSTPEESADRILEFLKSEARPVAFQSILKSESSL